MCRTQEQIPPRRKRRRTETDPLLGEPSELQPRKRLKSGIALHSAAFYDSLSTIPLTRRALKELDRRTGRVNSHERPISTPRRVYREESLKQLQRFARHGGPVLRDLRAYPAPTDIDFSRVMSSKRSSQSLRTQSTRPTSNATSSSRRSSAYDGAFEQHLVDNGIFPKGYDYPDGRQITEVSNLEDIHQRLAQPRPSLSPSCFSTSDFRAFERANDRVISEGKVMRTVFPTIYGNADIPNEGDLVFTQLESMTNGITVNAKPDFYDGARPEDINEQVREDLGQYIVPSTHQHAPAAPNFFTEAKPPKGGADVAKRQACYNGALGARAMHKLQLYGQDEPVFDNYAYTITTTYHDGTLKMYTTHPQAGPGNSVEYHMTQIRSLALTDTPDSFRHGATAFRNGRDWAQEQRDRFISVANKRAESMKAERCSFESTDDEGLSYDTDVQDTTPLAEGEDPEDESQFYLSQKVIHGEYKGSTFEESEYDDFSDATEVPRDEESETSADELSLDQYAKPTPLNKRRNKVLEKTIVKAPRYSDDKPRRRPRDKFR